LLVYEDEETRRLLINIFRNKGISVHCARNGNNLENLLTQKYFDVILSDVQLPKLEGLKLGKWLKKNKPEYLKKLIILTGFIDKEIEDYCENLNCEYFMKPIKKGPLIETIRRIIEKKP
jgi:DNA-binding NtrC family response regulator